MKLFHSWGSVGWVGFSFYQFGFLFSYLRRVRRPACLLGLLGFFSIDEVGALNLYSASRPGLQSSLRFGSPLKKEGPLVSQEELDRAVFERVMRVPQFVFLRSEGERLGVSIYLFGGTAAGFIQYVKKDLQREKGDSQFGSVFFDYDFTSIYRFTQDMDIVVDGSPKIIANLMEQVRQRYFFF